LGDRIPLKKKKKNKKSYNKLKTNPFVCNKRKTYSKLCFDENEDKDYDCVDEEEEQQLNDSRNESFSSDHNIHKKKRKIHKSTYFSDEEIEEESDD
jgi:hypothetical protein